MSVCVCARMLMNAAICVCICCRGAVRVSAYIYTLISVAPSGSLMPRSSALCLDTGELGKHIVK